MLVLKAFLICYFVGIVVGKADSSSRITSRKDSAFLKKSSVKAKTFKGLKLKENLNAMNLGSANECPCYPSICSRLAPGIIYSDGLCTEITDGGRWLVILRHKPGKTSAFTDAKWENYAKGFGASDVPSTSFWLGLRQVHRLTSTGKWQVLLKIKWNKEYQNGNSGPIIDDPLQGSTGFEIYDDFKVGPESGNFTLTVGKNEKRVNVPVPSGSGKSFHKYNNGLQFSTTDHGPYPGCALESDDGGGWWFESCTWVCLTCSPSSVAKELWSQDRDGNDKHHIPSEFVMAIRVMN